MSREQDDRVRRSRGPTQWGCDPEAGCGALGKVVGIPFTGRSRYAGPSSSVPGRPHAVGMRAAANTGSARHDTVGIIVRMKEEAV